MLLRAELAREYSGYPLVATGIRLWSNGKYGDPLIPLKLVGIAPGWGIRGLLPRDVDGVVVFGNL